MKKSFFCMIVMVGFLSACGVFAPGAQTTKDKTAHIQTFSDTNRNGKRDSDEAALPNVLIASQSNIHGGFTFTATRTDAAGEAEITTSYTHYFDLYAFTPCGYEATTPIDIQAKRKVSFGFAPVDPQSGFADFYILLWHDENQDGAYQTGELPLAGETLWIDPGLPWGEPFDMVSGELSVSTNSGGEAAANLGNSCGQAKISIPDGWQPATTSGEGSWENGWYTIPYQTGRTNIYLGIAPME